jgi:hypothetical protein
LPDERSCLHCAKAYRQRYIPSSPLQSPRLSPNVAAEARRGVICKLGLVFNWQRGASGQDHIRRKPPEQRGAPYRTYNSLVLLQCVCIRKSPASPSAFHPIHAVVELLRAYRPGRVQKQLRSRLDVCILCATCHSSQLEDLERILQCRPHAPGQRNSHECPEYQGAEAEPPFADPE